MLWNDELFTYYISRLPSMSDVWGALMSGGEQLPPFFYLVTRASVSVFGLNNIGLRFPEILGFWLMCVCLFIFVARRTSNFYGLLAAIFPLLTGAYYYAYEARPYGLMLGFGALALVCWQTATISRFRIISVIGLALSLAAALSSHYYGIFIIFPIALGEAVRTYKTKRFNFPIWAAFVFAVLPLILYFPLLKHARAYSGGFWAKPYWTDIPDFFYNLLATAVVPLTAIIFFAGIVQFFNRESERDFTDAENEFEYPLHEIAAAFGFLLIPFVCVALAKFVTGGFTDRYAISAIIGFGVLIPLIAARVFKDKRLIPAILIIFFVGWFGLLQLKAVKKNSGQPYKKISNLFETEETKTLPIVAAEPHTFIEAFHYAPQEIASRLVYLADADLSLKHLKHNSVERGMNDLLKPWFGLNVTDYETYIESHPQFLVYGKLGFLDWIMPQIREEGWQVKLLDDDGDRFLFLISRNDEKNTQ